MFLTSSSVVTFLFVLDSPHQLDPLLSTRDLPSRREDRSIQSWFHLRLESSTTLRVMRSFPGWRIMDHWLQLAPLQLSARECSLKASQLAPHFWPDSLRPAAASFLRLSAVVFAGPLSWLEEASDDLKFGFAMSWSALRLPLRPDSSYICFSQRRVRRQRPHPPPSLLDCLVSFFVEDYGGSCVAVASVNWNHIVNGRRVLDKFIRVWEFREKRNNNMIGLIIW